MNKELVHSVLEIKIKEHQHEITTLEYQLYNMSPPDLETYQRLYKLYMDNILIPDSITRENFYMCCKKIMEYHTTEQKLKQYKEDLSKLYTMYIDETLPIISKMDLK